MLQYLSNRLKLVIVGMDDDDDDGDDGK